MLLPRGCDMQQIPFYVMFSLLLTNILTISKGISVLDDSCHTVVWPGHKCYCGQLVVVRWALRDSLSDQSGDLVFTRCAICCTRRMVRESPKMGVTP